MNASSFGTFNDLHDLIAKTVAKIGLSNTILLLQSIVSGKNPEINKSENAKLLSQYILSRCIHIFDLNEDLFTTSPIREYREARMALFHLLKKYTHSSYSIIALQFDQKKRNIFYAVQKCDEIMTVPQFHKGFAEKYNSLQSQTLDFIAKLNSPNAHESSK